jgi:hypothetical protein
MVGVFFLIFVPATVVGTGIWYLLIGLPLMIFLLAILGLIYLGLMVDDISYGPKQIRKVQIPGAPENVQRLLKTTSLRGELIYVFLISVFEGGEKLSQQALVDGVRQRCEGRPLTYQSVRATYIKRLAALHLIEASERTREYGFNLTAQGRWCAEAVRICFPKTNFGYLKRHYLKLRKLEPYPLTNAQEPLKPTDVILGTSANHSVSKVGKR